MNRYYIKYPITKATEPPHDGACWIYRDRYWSVVDGCLLFWRGTIPQCNTQESITKNLDKKFEVRFLPLVFVPCNETNEGLSIDVSGDKYELEV